MAALLFYPSRRHCPARRPCGFQTLDREVPLSVMEHQMNVVLQDGLQLLNQLLSPPDGPPCCTQDKKEAEKKPEEEKKETKEESTPEEYQVSLDLTGFSPDDISVTTAGNKVRVQARHEARHADQTGHSFRCQELRREFVLPEGVDPDTVTSVLSKDGVLSIQAPRLAIQAAPPAEKTVPVQSAEVPVVENGSNDNGDGKDETTEMDTTSSS